MNMEEKNKSLAEKDTSAVVAQPAGGADKEKGQPTSIHDPRPGYGDKKLEGPNRPST